jgi:uncharacterized protein YceK
MKVIIIASLLTIITMNLPGCATISSKSFGGLGHKYSGIGCDFKAINNGFHAHKISIDLPLILSLFIIDVPLSLIADTLVLPLDLTKQNPKDYYDCFPPLV